MNAVTQRETEAPETTERISYQLPAVNIYETADGYLLEADMPGVSREGLEVYLDSNELTLVGHRSAGREGTTHYRESRDGDYRRVFELNPEIDTAKITARVDNGVLCLHLAKHERTKPRRISVTD